MEALGPLLTTSRWRKRETMVVTAQHREIGEFRMTGKQPDCAAIIGVIVDFPLPQDDGKSKQVAIR